MKKYILTLGLVAAGNFAFSQTENSKNDVALEVVNDTVKKRTKTIEEVVVTSNRVKKTSTIVKSGISVKDLPQSVQEIGHEVIEQQQSVRLSELVKNVNGVYVSSARGGAQESFYGRGYDMSANNIFKNGFRFNSGSIPEVSSLEKVEVLKGSAALLFGNVAPGGILNMVTKMPSFRTGGEVSMQMGSYSFYKPSIDFYGPLSNSIAYRFVGSYENSESFRDVVKKERYYLNPSFLFKLTNRTEMVLQGDFLNDDWTPDFGTAIIGKTIVDLPRNTYLGARWSTGNTKQASVSNLLTHAFNSNWKLNFNSSFQNYQRTSRGTERIVPAANGDLNRPYGQQKSVEKIFANQASLQGNFNTGKIKHQLFTGLDFENSLLEAYTFRFYNPAVSGNPTVANYDTVNIFDPSTYANEGPILPSEVTRIVKTDTKRFGIYAQDLISITDKIKVLAGLRWSWQEQQVDTHDKVTSTVSEAPKRKDVAFSPKAGLVYQPVSSVSLFASYANSFTPNSGTDVNLQAIEASIIDQYEVGVKKEFLNGKLTSNVTLYQIENSNLAQTAPFKADGTANADTQIKMLSGSTKSKGFEIDITAKPIEGLNILAGYSYNDMRYTKTSGTNGSFIVGDRVVRTPASTANLSFFYTLQAGKLKGLAFGALANYVGDRSGGWNDDYVWTAVTPATTPPTYTITIRDRDIPLEGYTTVDLSVGYTWKKFSVLCKLSNVTNELNYTVHENYSVNPIAPRQVMGSIKYKF